MNIDVLDSSPQDLRVQVLVAGLFEGETPADCGFEGLDTTLGNPVRTATGNEDFLGKSGQLLTLYGTSNAGPRHIFIVGLGKRDAWTQEKVRRAFGSAGKRARSLKLNDVAIVAPLNGMDPEGGRHATVAALEGFVLAMYRYGRRSKDAEKFTSPEEVKVLPGEDGNADTLKAAAETAAITIDATLFARDLVAMPGGELYPEAYARIAGELASEHISVDVLDHENLRELGMGALLAVGQGSEKPPVLIHLTYDPGHLGDDSKTFAIVGKGITFDAGGLDLKNAAGMRDMKVDMAGSAVVMGVFKALDRWKPNCRVEGFIASAENMPSGSAYHPGDILTSYKGVTIEIDNTDAEGRLALADALAYAVEKSKPDAMVDLATLTGACVVALGHHATGMMGTDDRLAQLLSEVGEQTGERVWRLPLWKEYREQLDSEVADIKNTGGRWGGAITAGAFLQEFVGETPWLHLDIAGTATEVPVSYAPHKELPTGVGVRLLLEALKQWA